MHLQQFNITSELRQIGWDFYDPIGLRNMGTEWQSTCADEYDKYMCNAASMLKNGESVSNVADYLEYIEIDHIELGAGENTRNRAEATANAIAKYILSIV